MQVHFLPTKQPANKAMNLDVGQDATVGEVIGYARYTKLDEALREDLKQKARLPAMGRFSPGSPRSPRENRQVRRRSICSIGSQHYYTTAYRFTLLMLSHYFITINCPQNELMESNIQRRLSRIAC